MGPSKCCGCPILKLDDIGMCPKSLLLWKKVFDGCAIEDEMGKSPGHDEVMRSCRLKVVLGEGQDFVKKFSAE
jgi:hypothetical protein